MVSKGPFRSIQFGFLLVVWETGTEPKSFPWVCLTIPPALPTQVQSRMFHVSSNRQQSQRDGFSMKQDGTVHGISLFSGQSSVFSKKWGQCESHLQNVALSVHHILWGNIWEQVTHNSQRRAGTTQGNHTIITPYSSRSFVRPNPSRKWSLTP